MSDTPAITVTDDASATIQSVLGERGLDPETAGIRLAVEQGGCAGLSYRFELAAEPAPGDHVSENAGVALFVDAESRPYLEGAELGFERTAHGTGFVVDNPNASQECGCGISFR